MNIADLYEIYLKHQVISTDSRKIEQNAIYFALKGDKFDGNEFAKQALSSGASYAIIDNKDFFLNDRTVLVTNVLETLQELANYHIKQLNIPVLAITGTNGKTTTKELIKTVLEKKFNVLATSGNLNNHIGVPLTILSLTKKHNFAVIEMGANHPYEIEQLCKIAEPTYGLITNIGKAHLEGFGGFQGVIKTKKELYDFVIQHNGTLFYNSDNTILNQILENQRVNKIDYNCINHGFCSGKLESSNPFINVRIRLENNSATPVLFNINSKLVGTYNVENILAAVTVGYYFGVSKEKIKEAIEDYVPTNNRSQLNKTDRNTLIIDCYNANPSSTEASLVNLNLINADKKLVILGDMLELGMESVQEHQKIIDILKKYELNAILVGKNYFDLAKNSGIKAFEDTEQLYTWIRLNPIKDSFILIKGSRGIKLEKIIELL